MRPLLLFLILPALSLAGEKPGPAAPVFPPDVRVERDVPFLAADREERADLYFPAGSDPARLAAAVVHIHGGGFTGGRRDSRRDINICANLARRGYLAMSVEYRLATRARPSWPQNLQDCKTAVRWLRANAARLGVDPARIGVIGGSAGGTLAALVALTDERDGLEPAGPLGEVSSRVRCGVVLYGIGDLARWRDTPMLGRTLAQDPALYRRASPVAYARADSPPLLLVHGSADEVVDASQSGFLAEALQKAGAPHRLVIVPGAPHSFHLEPEQRDLRPLVLDFFDRHLAP